MSRLPAPTLRYEPGEQAEMRRLVERDVSQLTEAVQSLRDAGIVFNAVSAAGNITVAAPAPCSVYVLDIKNTTGGSITVTLNAVFLGTFTSPSAGKRRTQMYWYDRGAAKLVPVGAQSPDL